VSLARLRGGERLALGSAIALAVLLALNWYVLRTPDARLGAHESGIRAIGWLAALLLVLAILCAIGLAVATVALRAPAWPVMLSVLTFALGVVAVATVAARLVFQPTLGVRAEAEDVELTLAAWLALAAAAGLAAGGWWAMSDERTGSAESREQTDEVLRVRGAPRPAPPAQADPPPTS
jgi:hypothetical protein